MDTAGGEGTQLDDEVVGDAPQLEVTRDHPEAEGGQGVGDGRHGAILTSRPERAQIGFPEPATDAPRGADNGGAATRRSPHHAHQESP